MTSAINPPTVTKALPDHTQLPESDSTFVFAERAGGKNFQEHPQSILLTDSIEPVLQKRHTDGQYCIGQDCGIYWRLTDPPERGAEAPDWFYVPNVPATLNGQFRRCYVLWQELIAPLIVLEFVSGDGDARRLANASLSEERDKTPLSLTDRETQQKPGKFWIYEQVIRPAFYGIYEVKRASIEVYHLVDSEYQLLAANERGNYPISPLKVELGIWQGYYQNIEIPWLRWWDEQGNLLLTGKERAEQAEQRAERLAAQLRAAGIEPEV